MGGDWKQLLPVVDSDVDPSDDPLTKAYHYSVKTTSAFVEKVVQRHRLTQNKRLGPDQEHYRRQLKCWGTGVTAEWQLGEDERHYFQRLDRQMCVRTEAELIDFVFGDSLQDPMKNLNKLRGAAILCPLNKDTFKMNIELMVNLFCFKMATDLILIITETDQIPCGIRQQANRTHLQLHRHC
jgi:hypothetical protein